jgi:NADH-quinone oxidoreductase subunit H
MLDFFKTQFGFSLVLTLVLFGTIQGFVAYCILLERKISAWLQDRVGPNRVGPAGLLQPIADGIKFFLKEDFIPGHVDKFLFVLAPSLAFGIAALGFAVIPWGGHLRFPGGELVNVQVASLDVGLLYILAVGSMSVYGVVIGGWASNNKYSFYGSMRATAQMLSYEVPMGLAILVIVMMTGQVRLENIVDAQLHSTWFVLVHPFSFLILLITAFAEANRAPFDLAEAEQELVGGYQTEYGAMKMGMFYLGEYAHMITSSAFMSVLFFGGWELFPSSEKLGIGWIHWLNTSGNWLAAFLRVNVMFVKIWTFIAFFMWIRWTLPRFRFDQLMRMAWRGLVPIGMVLVGWTALLVYWGKPISIWATIGEVAVFAVSVFLFTSRRVQITGRQETMPPLPRRAIVGTH